MDQRAVRKSTRAERLEFSGQIQAMQPELARAGVKASAFVGAWRMAASAASAGEPEVWLTFRPDGTGQLQCATGAHELIWQYLENIGGLMIMPVEIRYCQPGPQVTLCKMHQGTCRIRITHAALLPAGAHEFFKHRDAPVATLAKGEVLRLARRQWLLGAGGCLIVAALALYWSIPGRTILDPIRGILCALFALGGFATCLRWLWPKDRRLVIGTDRVQLVDGKETVVGQLPYDQIESVHFFHGHVEEESFFYHPAVTVRVTNLGRADTFWPGIPNEQREFVLHDRFESPPDEIRKLLRSRWQQCKMKRELQQAPPGQIPSDVDMIG